MTTVEAPLTMKTSILPEGDLPKAFLERYVTVAGNNVRRRAHCPLIANETDAELACKVYEEFQDISSQNRFHLNTGALKFEYFRQCLAGQARAHWDVAANNQADESDASFSAAIVEWFANYFEPTAFHDQKQYFLQATKAFSMSVKDTATRVEQITRYMRFMPGAPAAGTPVYSDTEKKMVLYRLMLPAWRTNFDVSGNVITNDTYTWHNLVTYFNSPERRENRRQRAQNGGRGRGASPGRGGRGFGRGRGMTRRAPFQGGRPSQ